MEASTPLYISFPSSLRKNYLLFNPPLPEGQAGNAWKPS